MKQYEVGFNYKVEEFGVLELEAMDDNEAEAFVEEHIKEVYPEAVDYSIEYIKVIKV